MFYSLNNIIMDKKTLTTIVATAVISSTPVNADTLQKDDINKIVCTTKQACEKLSNSIKAQIEELENKGLENLTESEFNKYDKLSDELIAVENNKQEKMRQSQNKKIEELRGALY